MLWVSLYKERYCYDSVTSTVPDESFLRFSGDKPSPPKGNHAQEAGWEASWCSPELKKPHFQVRHTPHPTTLAIRRQHAPGCRKQPSLTEENKQVQRTWGYQAERTKWPTEQSHVAYITTKKGFSPSRLIPIAKRGSLPFIIRVRFKGNTQKRPQLSAT